jgi:hypothetical protein
MTLLSITANKSAGILKCSSEQVGQKKELRQLDCFNHKYSMAKGHIAGILTPFLDTYGLGSFQIERARNRFVFINTG